MVLRIYLVPKPTSLDSRNSNKHEQRIQNGSNNNGNGYKIDNSSSNKFNFSFRLCGLSDKSFKTSCESSIDLSLYSSKK